MLEKAKELLGLINRDEALIEVYDKSVRNEVHLNLTGFCESAKPFVAAALARREGRKPVFVVPDSIKAREISAGLRPFIDGEVLVLYPREMTLVNVVASSKDNEMERVGVISRLISGDFGAAIICAGALLNKMAPKRIFTSNNISLELGGIIDPEELSDRLIKLGYTRTNLVELPGEFARRGDIVDIFFPNKAEPIRISFFDDEVDRISTFNIEDQRSTDNLRAVKIGPAREILLTSSLSKSATIAINRIVNDESVTRMANRQKQAATILRKSAENDIEVIKSGARAIGLEKWIDILYPEHDNILDYLDSKKTRVFVDELMEVRSRADIYLADYMARYKAAFEMGSVSIVAASALFEIPDVLKRIDKTKSAIALSCLKSSGNGLPGGNLHTLISMASDSYRGDLNALATIARNYASGQLEVAIIATGANRIEKIREQLLDMDVILPPVIEEALPSGFVMHDLHLLVIGEQDLFGSEKTIKKKKSKGAAITFFGDLEPGDYVVHDENGIGRYEGLVAVKIGGSTQDYLKITYAKEHTLMLPMDRLGTIQKYVGPQDKPPKLSNLDSGEWNKSVTRARASIKKLAFNLVTLYAVRRANKGWACGPDDEWQKEFEEAFPYVETDDQNSAIADIKKDMETETPMDRLLCGDVGFGKTEVAFRAIFKCVTNGRQAFMLAPTTLLVQQHYENFLERIGNFPIKVRILSRFVSPKVIEQTLKEIREGKVDVVFGTHRLLSKDVVPNSLGLLVIDEEQRFGVGHKEQIKTMRNNIDVLSLSATPIPRTLHMSMAGIRDISVLNDAPINRRPIQTYVMGYDAEVITQACLREISRKGQIFYLYNRTEDIDKKAAELSELMPGARVVYAHGQMSESQLERIISCFIAGEADILVCTTIIESGVDMPNVNTMIVENGDRFGLAQLYQIRGRVGRSERQAYAYITYDEKSHMSPDAKKRLSAIRDFTELGSGIKIAMRDLEVRGAGNLLGAEQHGHLDSIGYELYCRLLDEEIKRIRKIIEERGLLSKDGKATNASTDAANDAMNISEEEDISTLIDEQLIAEFNEREERVEAKVEFDYDMYIPADYIVDNSSRMIAYRRIAEITTKKQYDDFIDEIEDRYGEAPVEVLMLANVSFVRNNASIYGFETISVKPDKILFTYQSADKPSLDRIGAVINHPDFDGKTILNALGKPYIHYISKNISARRASEIMVKFFEIYSADPVKE